MLLLRCQRKKLKNLSHLNYGIQIRLQRVGILQEKMYKTRISDLDELKQRLSTEWTKLDHVVIATVIRQLRRRELQISYGHVLY